MIKYLTDTLKENDWNPYVIREIRKKLIHRHIKTFQLTYDRLTVETDSGIFNFKHSDIKRKRTHRMNTPRLLSDQELSEMLARGWKMIIKAWFENPKDLFDRYIRYYQQVKIYYRKTNVRGQHSILVLARNERSENKYHECE